MTYYIKIRRDTPGNWTTINPVLMEGELGFEFGTRYFKMGDGSTAWNSLPYVVDEDAYLPDAAGVPDGHIIVAQDEGWVITEPASSLPDPSGLADGKIITTVDEEWVVGDLPEPPDTGPDLHSSASWNVAAEGDLGLTLAATPFEESLQIYKNGLLLRPGSSNDYTVSSLTVTFTNPLSAGDVISDHYWTAGTVGETTLIIGATPEIVPPVSGDLINLNYNYQHNFVLPTGVVDDDLMIAAWNNWHGWGVNTAGGWISEYEPNGGTVVCYKFVNGEDPGDTVTPSLSGQGYRAAGQLVIVRGADLTDPIYALTTGGASISVGSEKRRVIHMVEQGGGGADPTLSRGVEIQHEYDGTIGVRASEEEVLAGGSVACSTNTGFLASIAIRGA